MLSENLGYICCHYIIIISHIISVQVLSEKKQLFDMLNTFSSEVLNLKVMGFRVLCNLSIPIFPDTKKDADLWEMGKTREEPQS